MNSKRMSWLVPVPALLNVVLLAASCPWGAAAQDNQDNTPPPPNLSPDKLNELVAPIALYPDPLLAQVLAASTFPLDVVEAARWADQNKSLKGQQLSDAVVKANLPYDPSVISLIQFPSVLSMLSEKIDWTTDLGNAFLTQRGDVMDAVQLMRLKAKDAGNLKSSDQVKVVDSSPDVIEIQPSDPEVIYVPTYSPTAVYAPPPPPSAGAAVGVGLLSFGVGVAVGAAASHSGCCWYGGSVGWSNHTVVVANNSFNRNWASRGYVPRPAPYYRAGGPYPAGRAPIGSYGGYANRNANINNANVNSADRRANIENNAARNNIGNSAGNRANGVNSAERGASGFNNDRGGGLNARGNRGYEEPSSGRSTAFSGAQNGSRESSFSQRGQMSRGGGGGRRR
jgi:hypothetical protein